MREALRTYFKIRAQFPEEEPTPADIRALKEARHDLARGETVPLEKALRELHSRPRQNARENSSPNYLALTVAGLVLPPLVR